MAFTSSADFATTELSRLSTIRLPSISGEISTGESGSPLVESPGKYRALRKIIIY